MKVIGLNSYPNIMKCKNGGSDGRKGDKYRKGLKGKQQTSTKFKFNNISYVVFSFIRYMSQLKPLNNEEMNHKETMQIGIF